MDLNSMLLREHSDSYVAAKLDSGRRFQPGTGSVVVAMIGGTASVLRRAATRIEAWSKGSSDGRIAPHQVSAR